MDFSIKEIKKRARADIKGQLGKCFIVSLIIMLLVFIFEAGCMYLQPETAAFLPPLNVSTTFIIILGALFLLFVYAPVCVGMSKFYLKLAKKEDVKISDIFYYDNLKLTVISYLLYELVMGMIVGLYMLLVWLALESLILTGALATMILVVAIVFYVFFMIEFGFGLSQVFYVVAEEIAIAPIDTLDISYKMMKGEKWNLFKLIFSFIGWMFLVVFTCGIASIYVIPYMNAATAEFYLYLREKKFENENDCRIEEF